MAKPLSIRLPDDLDRRVHEAASDPRTETDGVRPTVAGIVRQALRDWLRTRDNRKRRKRK